MEQIKLWGVAVYNVVVTVVIIILEFNMGQKIKWIIICLSFIFFWKKEQLV